MTKSDIMLQENRILVKEWDGCWFCWVCLIEFRHVKGVDNYKLAERHYAFLLSTLAD